MTAPVLDKLKTEGRMPAEFGAGQVPPTPTDEAGPSEPPARPGMAGDALPPGYMREAPPSYEDAVATNMPPVSAPRPDYAPPLAAEDDLLGRDEKRGWVDHRHRRGSEAMSSELSSQPSLPREQPLVAYI
ncbi:hypothetical protein LTS16_019512 [Friedmanniomyces endolithicus]|nr:hypothetical protein LTR57_019387 [Friedmanniomyces endolithicus]KAK1029648.1 hypothetical protein LTS16_019512 [Friedmanniomyces endolithicus]